MDDVDAVQAQIARNMLTSGDWVTARIDGIIYLEKSPLIYWLIAISYKIFGAFDWAARIPVALSCVALAWLTAAFGTWAFGRRAGFYAGLVRRHLRRPVPVYADSDSRRDADRHHRALHVGVPARAGRTRRRIRASGRSCWPRASGWGCCSRAPSPLLFPGGAALRLSAAHAAVIFGARCGGGCAPGAASPSCC